MAGTLQVENLIGPTTGANTNKVVIPAGQTLDASAGTLVPGVNQVMQHLITKPTTKTEFTSTSYADAAGFSITITPKYASSKILIRFWAQTQQNNSGSGNSAHDHRIMRDSTQIYTTQWRNYFNTSWATSDFYPQLHTQFIDMPSSTSSITYKVQGRVYGGGSGNRPWSIGDYNGGSYDSVMEVVEIKQ